MKLFLLALWVAAGASSFAHAKDSTNALRRTQLTGQVLGLDLFDTNTQTKIVSLVNNSVVVIPSNVALSVQAVTNSPNLIGSVRFGFNRSVSHRIENVHPYFFCALSSTGDMRKCTILSKYGTHTVSAQACSGVNGTGTCQTPVRLTYSVVATAPVTPAPVTSAPVTSAPVTSAPVTSAPITSTPTIDPFRVVETPVSPATRAPITEAPVTKAPTLAPQTPVVDPWTDAEVAAPVTSAPVTNSPTLAPLTPVVDPWTNVEVAGPVTPVTRAPRYRKGIAPRALAPQTLAPVTPIMEEDPCPFFGCTMGPNMVCIIDNGSATCVCKPGYQQDAIGLYCIPAVRGPTPAPYTRTAVCPAKYCAGQANTVCKVMEGKPTCQCMAGTSLKNGVCVSNVSSCLDKSKCP